MDNHHKTYSNTGNESLQQQIRKETRYERKKKAIWEFYREKKNKDQQWECNISILHEEKLMFKDQGSTTLDF